jgi:hypothetical protein
MAAPVDREKVRRIFQEVTSKEDITPSEFEDMLANLNGDELLLLRQFLVNARCNSIRALAERGWPLMQAKPN